MALGSSLGERPGVGDHIGELRLAGLPPELSPDPLAGRDQHRRVTGAPGRPAYRGRTTGHGLCSSDLLAPREAVAVTEIEDLVLPRAGPLQRQQVGSRQILDVDVVTDRGAVRGGLWSLLESH